MTSQDRLKQIYHIVFMISEAITDFNNRYDKKSFTEKDLIKQICEYLDYTVEHQDFCDSFFALRNDVKVLDILRPYFEGAILDGDFHFRFTPEQEKIIKEWLNNGK